MAATAAAFVLLPAEVLQRSEASIALGHGFEIGQQAMRAFRTGDLGHLDAEGMLHVSGRQDLQVKIDGKVRYSAWPRCCRYFCRQHSHLGDACNVFANLVFGVAMQTSCCSCKAMTEHSDKQFARLECC